MAESEPDDVQPIELVGYLAPEGFSSELQRELGDSVLESHGRLFIARPSITAPAWVANTWQAPRRLRIASIGDAARQLRAMQRNWALCPHELHRRAALIEERLPKVSARPLVFGQSPPSAPLGSWMLLATDTVLASPVCSSPFPNGEARFVEDRIGPPSRAYLKLWELFTLLGARPRPGERCIDLGASPGGWSWVLQSLGARVLSVDKAPLEPRIASLPGIEIRRDSAFGLDPSSVGPADWLFCDVICYPERLLGLVERWIAARAVRRIVCSIKFQGATDFTTQARFAAIPGSRLMHLSNNKHELTWVKL